MIRDITMLAATLLLTVSCSGGSEKETVQGATSAPTAMVAPPTAMPGPTLEPDNLENKQILSDQHDWEYIEFTHTPVDFQQLMSEDSLCPYYPALQPFFNYFITSPTEGPKNGACLHAPRIL